MTSDSLGVIPQSNALAEARVESLSEFLSRDPEGYTRADRDRLVAELRKMRERFQAAEAQGKVSRAPKKLVDPKAKAGGSSAPLVVDGTLDDLGI